MKVNWVYSLVIFDFQTKPTFMTQPTFKTLRNFIVSALVTGCFSTLNAQNVLIIYDDSPTNVNTVALKNTLTNAGYPATISTVNETAWNNTNPPLTNFDVVIRLNGSTYGTEITNAGQLALVDFVENNGGAYVHFEWDAYQFDQNSQMQNMEDLILFQRTSGSTSNLTLTEVSSQSNHPILANVPASFNLTSCGFNVGSLRSFSNDPSVTLMTDGTNPAVAIREFGAGCVLGFHNAGNYNGSTVLSDSNLQRIIIDYIGYCGYCGVDAIPFDSSVSCYGYSDGIAGVTVSGGTPPYSFEWSTSDTTTMITGLTSGNYTVTVLDSGGCQTIKTIHVGQPTAISTNIAIKNGVLCNGDMTGEAKVHVAGGTPPFTYAWSNGETADSAMALPGGQAIVTVTDSNGCQFLDTALITEPDAIVGTYTVVPVECDGDLGGSLTVSTSGGIPPYNYTWSTGGSSTYQGNLTNGIYVLTIMDVVGCQLIDSVVLHPLYLSPEVDLGPDLDICSDWPVSVGAGNPGASYLWSTNSTSQSIIVAYAGEYWVKVTNDSGCATYDTINVSVHTCVGIDEIMSTIELNVYPNPAEDIVYIVSDKTISEEIQIGLYNITGELVFTTSVQRLPENVPFVLDLSTVAKGSYIIKMQSKSHRAIHTVVIQ